MRAIRFAALVAAIAATSVSALSLASNAHAAPCGARAGVTVVVQYGDPVGTSIGCATGDPATGLEALKSSGHHYTFVPRQPGFVCAIDARPDPCNNGPADAYWSYWHGHPGGAWSYGSIGAGSYDPPLGSVEGWSFGGGTPPGSRVPVATTSGTATALRPRPTASATRSISSTGRGGLGGLVGGVGLTVILAALAGYLGRRRSHVSE